MAQSVSANFTAAEKADVAKLAAKVQLVLGDYANANAYSATATSSGDDVSGNYPASGAINGDRSELNVGAASGADNGIGKASWKSSGVPSLGDFVWLQINFPVVRTINRIKLYHINSHALKTYAIEYWDFANQSWNAFVTSDQTLGSQWGYGQGPYGDTPFGGVGAIGITTVVPTYKVDVIDTPSVQTTALRIIVTDTQAGGDNAQLLEMEVYNVIDITSRVIGFEIHRERDWKLQNNIASTAKIDVDNGDRFFSVSHTPTQSEVGSGFANSDLRPNMGIIIKEGFAYGGDAGELVTKFTGFCDVITINAKDRSATIECRDYIKHLINQVVSTKLKTSQDIQLNMQYLLNLANVSNWDMSLDSTTITLDYFFVYNQSVFTSIQQLVQACGDAGFWIDETGTVQFRMWMNSVPQVKTWTSEADFEAGTLTNLDTTSNAGAILRKWFIVDDFSDGDLTANPAWTYDANAFVFSVIASKLNIKGGNTAGLVGGVSTPFLQTTGTFRARIDYMQSASTMFLDWFFISSATTQYGNGYSIRIRTDGAIKIARFDGGVYNELASYTGLPPTGLQDYRVYRDSTGAMTVWLNGTQILTATDNTYTTSANMHFTANDLFGTSANVLQATDIYWTNANDSSGTPSNTAASWISAAWDQGATLQAEGIFQATTVNAAGTSVSYSTATSTDNVTYDAYVAATPGSAIASAVKRYIKVKALLNCPTDDGLHNANTATPTINDITINYTTGAGSQKYHASVDYNLRYDGSMLDVRQSYSDDLGGDTAVINNVLVSSAPLILTGADTDTQWQGTVGVPAAAISATNTLTVGVQTYTYNCVVSGGMDTARMTGANPAAAVVTFGGGATGSWSFTTIHPTQPVLSIVVTGGGTITDLRLIGKHYANTSTPYQASSTDAQSQALYNNRQQSINNNYIINSGIAANIAARIILLFKAPIIYLTNLALTPTPSMQLGDRLNIVDYNTDISQDYNVIALTDKVSMSSGKIADAQTEVVPVKI